ncbi:hypothetical protein LTS18_001508 [Coniosporium uncinatum]|uniref:Uncharacterized protein n=1 Tax=Coniosporium uncinatum TaxID=93489 RepID=A0ACC3DEY6_9PEZI|nr:hypothetical protein LTS18_001508 [Coniosporium uncinatum]
MSEQAIIQQADSALHMDLSKYNAHLTKQSPDDKTPFADLMIECSDGATFWVHKIVVCSQSEYIRNHRATASGMDSSA